jgi:hypothetical protein
MIHEHAPLNLQKQSTCLLVLNGAIRQSRLGSLNTGLLMSTRKRGAEPKRRA